MGKVKFGKAFSGTVWEAFRGSVSGGLSGWGTILGLCQGPGTLLGSLMGAFWGSMYRYIYIERERDREIERDVCIMQ